MGYSISKPCATLPCVIHPSRVLSYLIAMYCLALCVPSESSTTHLEAMYYLDLRYPSKSSAFPSCGHALPSLVLSIRIKCFPSRGHVNLALCDPSESTAIPSHGRSTICDMSHSQILKNICHDHILFLTDS